MTINQNERQVFDLINEERTNTGLSPLSWHSELDNAAESYSEDMAVNDFFSFSHIGSDGSTFTDRITGAGYDGWLWAENIGAGYSTPEAIVQGWMDSPGHRANILSPDLEHIGVGYYYLPNDTGSVNWNHYWTADFGAGDTYPPGDPDPDILGPDVPGAGDPDLNLLRREFEIVGMGPQIFNDWVGDTDTVDTYAFSKPMVGTDSFHLVNIQLNNLSSDADIRLIADYNSNGIVDYGEILDSSTNGGTLPESIIVGLSGGDYFLQVYQYSGDTNYQLTFA